MTLIHHDRPIADAPLDAEALIREAWDRQRRRRLRLGFLLLLAVLGTVGYLSSAELASPRVTPSGSSAAIPAPVRLGPAVSPKAPESLTVGSGGILYVVDTGRDEILRYGPGRAFHVVAGNGKEGFSPDGTPALRARLRLRYYSGIAVARDGAVYFSDAGNGLVREVLPDGVLHTVAGGGWRKLGTTALRPRSADFSTAYVSVAGLAVGPHGALYIATQKGVYRLGTDGRLHWVVGGQVGRPPKDWGGVYSNPAIQEDFANAARIAFDGEGDLFVAGGGGWGLYERTSNAKLRFIEVLRGEGAGFFGSLASAPGGSVVAAYNFGLQRIEGDGAVKAIKANLAAPLGRMGGKGPENSGEAGYGVTVGPEGQIYVDIDQGVLSSTAAILEVQRGGQVTPLWRS